MVGGGQSIAAAAASRACVDWDFAQKELRNNTGVATSSTNSASIKTENARALPCSSPTAPPTAEDLQTAARTCLRVDDEGDRPSSGNTRKPEDSGGDENAVSDGHPPAASDEDLQGGEVLATETAANVVPTSTSSGCCASPLPSPTSPIAVSQREPSAAAETPSPAEPRPCAKDPPSPGGLPATSLLVVVVEAATSAAEGEGRKQVEEGALSPRGGVVKKLPSAAVDGVPPCAGSPSSPGFFRVAPAAATEPSTPEAPRSLQRDIGGDRDQATVAQQRPSTTAEEMESKDTVDPASPIRVEAQKEGGVGSPPQDETPPSSSTETNKTPIADSSAAATAVYAHKVKAALDVELKRAREAWRGAEGELERSQEERDELRAALQLVSGRPGPGEACTCHMPQPFEGPHRWG